MLATIRWCTLLNLSHDRWSNMRDQITSERRSKLAWSYCFCAFHSFIVEVQTMLATYSKCCSCIVATWRLGLRAPLDACNKMIHIVLFFDDYKSIYFKQSLGSLFSSSNCAVFNIINSSIFQNDTNIQGGCYNYYFLLVTRWEENFIGNP